MFHHLGRIVSRHWIWVLVFWALVLVGIRSIAPRWDDVTRDGDFAYLPHWASSVQGERLLEAAFRQVRYKSHVVVILARSDGPLRADDFHVADRLIDRYSAQVGRGPIVNVISYRTPVVGQKLLSPSSERGQAMLIILQLSSELMAVENMDLLEAIFTSVQSEKHQHGFPSGLEIGVTGSAAIGSDMLLAARQSIRNTETTTIVLVLLFLALVYRAPGLVLVPVLTIAVSVASATSLVALLSDWSHQVDWIDLSVYKTTRIFIVVLLFGAGVDYCLFLIARYREELAGGADPPAAIHVALAQVGHALAASALTTILGLGMMVFSDYGKFRNSGPVIGLCLAVGLLACITLAPALLRAGGLVVFWPFAGRLRQPSDGPHGGNTQSKDAPEVECSSGPLCSTSLQPTAFAAFWDAVSRLVVRYPIPLLVLTAALFAPLAYRGLAYRTTYDLLSELDASRPSVQGTNLLRRYFPAGEIGPTVLLAYDPKADFSRPAAHRTRLRRLSEQLCRFSYRHDDGRVQYPIVTVRSLAQPLGQPTRPFGLLGALRLAAVRGSPQTRATYLAQNGQYANKVTRLDLVFQFDPFSPEAIRLLDHLEQYLHGLAADPNSQWFGTRFYLLGTTAAIRDLKTVTTADRQRIQWTVPLAVFLVLVVILRRPLICAYLLGSVVFGYLVTLGATTWLFDMLYGPAFPGLDWKVPIFLFVLLIAVGEDYNIYLVSRVFEEQARRGRVEGLRVGLARTGGIITSCGLIMAGTFASMISGRLRAMQELGFALALGLLIDTFVIRTILVPAFLRIWPFGSAKMAVRHDRSRPFPNGPTGADSETKAETESLPET